MLYTSDAIKTRKNKENKFKKNINIIIYIFLLPILIYNLSLIIQSVLKPYETPNFLGIKTYVIISGSMQPELKIGDIVVVKKITQEDLKIGDIISFRHGQSVITHRISRIIEEDGERKYITKGDFNNAEDSESVTYNNIEGKVIRSVPQFGKIALMLQDKIVIIFLIIVLYIYLVYSGELKKKKMQRRMKRIDYEKKKYEENLTSKKS